MVQQYAHFGALRRHGAAGKAAPRALFRPLAGPGAREMPPGGGLARSSGGRPPRSPVNHPSSLCRRPSLVLPPAQGNHAWLSEGCMAISRSSLALNNLRAFVILIVLAFHSVLAYLDS